jgi:hypothetical protein
MPHWLSGDQPCRSERKHYVTSAVIVLRHRNIYGQAAPPAEFAAAGRTGAKAADLVNRYTKACIYQLFAIYMFNHYQWSQYVRGDAPQLR